MGKLAAVWLACPHTRSVPQPGLSVCTPRCYLLTPAGVDPYLAVTLCVLSILWVAARDISIAPLCGIGHTSGFCVLPVGSLFHIPEEPLRAFLYFVFLYSYQAREPTRVACCGTCPRLFSISLHRCVVCVCVWCRAFSVPSDWGPLRWAL